MSIIHSFDPVSDPVITLDKIYPKSQHTLDVCIINFSYKIMDVLLSNGALEPLDDVVIGSVSCEYPMYRVRGTHIGVIKTTVGAPITATLQEEVGHIFSCKKFVIFGSCGGLDKSIPPTKIIVPTSAYRDEGVSYHYAPAEDYIEIRNHKVVARILEEIKIPHVLGKTWSTDAFYRETRYNMERRISEGCIAVEMELAACQAVADFRGYELYNFLYRADNLDSDEWERSALSDFPIDERVRHFYIALEIAKRII